MQTELVDNIKDSHIAPPGCGLYSLLSPPHPQSSSPCTSGGMLLSIGIIFGFGIDVCCGQTALLADMAFDMDLVVDNTDSAASWAFDRASYLVVDCYP